MAQDLAFECPHCQETVRVAPAAVGEVINCPECDREFQARAPVGRQVSQERLDRSDQPVKQEADLEGTLREVHPAVFRNHLLMTLGCLLVAGAGIAALVMGLAGTALFGLAGTPLLIAGGVLLAAAALYAAYRWLQSISTTLKVTTERTIVVRGLISQSTNEVQHDDVRNIQCDRNFLERMFNYGDIALSSSGQDDMEIVVHDIPDPLGIIEIIRKHQ